MPGDGDGRAAMTFGGLQARIEIAHMAVCGSAQMGGANGGFHEGPFLVKIDEAGAAGMMSLAAGGEHARDQPAVTGQLFGAGETGDVTDLEGDHRTEDFADARCGLQSRDHGMGRDGLANLFLDLLHPYTQFVEGHELLLQHVGGVSGQLRQRSRQKLAASRSEQICNADVEDAVTVQGGVDAVLEHGAQVPEGHTRAQDLALIAKFAWRNPDLRKRAVAQQNGQAFGVEGIGLMSLAHHLLSCMGLCQVRAMAGLFDLVYQPIPMTGRFDGDLAGLAE